MASDRCWKDISQREKAVCRLDAIIWICLGEHVSRHLRVMCVCQLHHSCRSSVSELISAPAVTTYSEHDVRSHRFHVFRFCTLFKCPNTKPCLFGDYIQLESICIVQSRCVLFLAGWEGILRCVNRLANCAWPLTESVIACVLEHFAWRVSPWTRPASEVLRNSSSSLFHVWFCRASLAILSVTQHLINI